MTIAFFGAMSLVNAQELIKGAAENAYVANGVAIQFPSGWKTETEGKQNFVRAATADGSSKIFLYVTANSSFDSVKEQILDKYLTQYTNVENVGQDNLERDGLGLRTDTFKGKINNSNFTITAQSAFVLGIEPVKTVLLIAAVRDNAEATYGAAVREVFASEKSAPKTTASAEPKSGLKVTIDVKVFDDIDGNAAEVEEHFTKAFQSLGVEVVPNDAPDVIALHIDCGKDDNDDDNDGVPDAKDADDDNDGEDDAKEAIEEVNLDAEAGTLTDDFADKDKSSGIYFEIDGEDGIDLRFESSADSLDESIENTKQAATFFNNGVFFRKASFSPAKNFPLLIPSADCLRQKMALRATLARCKDAACKNSVNSRANSLGCI